MTKDIRELDNICKNLQLFMQHKDRLGTNLDIASYESMIRQSLKRILKLTLSFSKHGLLTDPSIDHITSNLYNMYESSNVDEAAINMELEDLISKMPLSVPIPSAGVNRVPADEVDPINNQDNKRRQKLKRKKTVETYDEDESTDESEDDQCPQIPLPSAGPDLLEQLREQKRIQLAIAQIANKTRTIETNGETMRKGESMVEIDETQRLVSKNWVDFLVENEEYEAAKNDKTNRDNAQDFDDVTLPRYGKEANKPKKKNKKSKENSSPSKKAKLSKSKDKKGKKKSRPVPVESDAVSEGDLLDEEEAGVPSQRPPKMNGKKSKSPKKGKKHDVKGQKKISKKSKSAKSSATEASATETDASPKKSPRKKAQKGKKRNVHEMETDITATETDATEASPRKKGKKKVARKINVTETEATSATETEAIATETDATETSPSKKKIKKSLVSPEDAQAENDVFKKMQHFDKMLNQSVNVSRQTSDTPNFPRIQAELEMPQGPEVISQQSVHSVQSSFGGPIDSMDIIYDKYIEILDNQCNDMAEFVTLSTTNFISSVYEVLPPLEQRMNLLLRRIDILERILDTEKTTFDLKPGKSIRREEVEDGISLHNKPSWVRAFGK